MPTTTQEEPSNRRPEEEAGVLIFKCSESRVPPVVRRVLNKKGWREWNKDTDPEELWSLHWKSGRFKISDWDRCLEHQRINHCPKSSAITKKDNLHRNIKRLQGSYGVVYNFVPTTFVLPNEYVAFMREYSEQEEGSIWICKPSDSSRGRGIFLINDMSQLIYDQQYVVQQYIRNPLCLGGFKFDLRLYVLITSFHPIRCYLYNEGLCRFATDKYSDDMRSLNNLYCHLTNSSINKYSPSLNQHKDTIGPGCKWTITRLRKYFRDTGIDDHYIFERIKNIIILTVLALWPKVPRQSAGFELFGFDVMIDSDLNPWLIEVNSSPALSTDSELDCQVKDPLLSDTIDMLEMKPPGKEPKGSGKPGFRRRTDTGSTLERKGSFASTASASSASSRSTNSTARSAADTVTGRFRHSASTGSLTSGRSQSTQPSDRNAPTAPGRRIGSARNLSDAKSGGLDSTRANPQPHLAGRLRVGEGKKLSGSSSFRASSSGTAGTGGPMLGGVGKVKRPPLPPNAKAKAAESSGEEEYGEGEDEYKPEDSAEVGVGAGPKSHASEQGSGPRGPSAPQPAERSSDSDSDGTSVDGKKNGFDLIFPATKTASEMCDVAVRNGSIDIRPHVQAIKEYEAKIRKEARSKTAKKDIAAPASTALPILKNAEPPGPWWMSAGPYRHTPHPSPLNP